EDMNIADMQEIAKESAKLLNAGNHGLIITHGTDILHYTAAAVALMLNNPARPIALVGAQRSPDRASFDGSMNLLCAAHYVASDIGETAVVMHADGNDVYCHANPATKVRKMHTSRRDAFRTINSQPIARVYPDGRIEELRENRRANDDKVVADTRFENKIALVKLVPGLDPEILQYYKDKKYRGLIIEGFGLGHVPNETRQPGYNWVKAVKKVVDAGIFVGITSQCINGRVNSNVYRNLRDLAATGATHLEDMLPETAYIKLGCALGRFKDVDKAKKFMLKNVAGEFNPRLTE
ncbi:glutamyl-tRNA(Gln) amidotransferase subunit D, partial [Candidatus Micrarchaeota archaeon CG1_02_55_22]